MEDFEWTDWQRLIQTLVRAFLSLGGHVGAIFAIIYLTTEDPAGNSVFTGPEWLTPMFALVITWYFATRETGGGEALPSWQAAIRVAVRSLHALGGAGALLFLFLAGHDIPQWWVAIYLSILTFYFIELRDPPTVGGENPERRASG